ncbi:hypothetical protein R1sor_013047 [Riccia sorocarpa]|uniref:Uncharacterized protein n=1 Tax=Riccia sorocarpa TaxID=122646 RepID=A0ABD3H5Z5_9MARC
MAGPFRSGAAGSPIACYRVRSWCHQWLCVELGELGKVKFSRNEGDSCRIVLRPCVNGCYSLQVVPSSITKGCCNFTSAPQNPEVLDRQDSRKTSEEILNGSGWFLGVRGSSIILTEGNSDQANLQFSLEFDEHGRVRIRGGHDMGYLTADARGRIWAGTQRAQKWEHFTLIEEALRETPDHSFWTLTASVRVTLQAHTGRYMCGASAVITADAEAACCCEEFLLDLKFPSLIPVRSFRHGSPLLADSLGSNADSKSKPLRAQEAHENSGGSVCTIRTADGKRMLSAEPDGVLFTTPVDQVRGMEKFLVKVQYSRNCRTVSFRRYSNGSGNDAHYLSATQTGTVVCSRDEGKHLETFGLNVANGSRVLIRSIHGGYLAYDPSLAVQLEHSESRHRLQKGLCSCAHYTKEEMYDVGAWQLRYHGDSLYTLVALPVAKGGAQEYLSVDSKGRIIQSGAPAVHFPATASLFEIAPVSGACLDTMDENICSFSGVVGFTIRTVRRIHGQQRYVSVEPSGKVFATRVRPSRWEIFHFVDIDATASVSSPEEFSCIPAAMNLNSPGSGVLSSSGYRVQQRVPSLGGQGRWGLVRRVGWVQPLGASDTIVQGIASSSSSAAVAAGEALRRACGVTAGALSIGSAVPKRSPTTLQELCIGHVCWFAATDPAETRQPDERTKTIGSSAVADIGLDSTDPELRELVAILRSSGRRSGIPPELIDGNLFSIPDDLLTRIWGQWRSRQPPVQSCKWLPSSLLAQLPHQFHNGVRPLQNHVGRPHGPPYIHQGLPPHNIAHWNSGGDGFHCSTCDAEGVLSMDPATNPAHHRYLEVQYRAYSSTRQPGVLWSAISFAGMSLMTTALACRVISLCRVSVSIRNA